MEAPITKAFRETELPENFKKPFGLDKNIAFLISRYLDNKDLINICQSSKEFRGIFYPSLERRLIILFLQYVVAGRLDKVEEILGKNPKLASVCGNVTYLSGRYFESITGFQYAVWAGDEEMWNIFLTYLPETDAHAQLVALMKENSDIIKKHGPPLSFFNPLLTAYRRYIDNLNRWDWSQREVCWSKEIGGAQRNMPAWLIYMFSDEGEDKAWPTKQMTKAFSRQSDYIKIWFEVEFKGGKCGSTFAFFRGVLPKLAWDLLIRFGEKIDHENSAALKRDRTKKLEALTERLGHAAKKASSVSPMMNRK